MNKRTAHFLRRQGMDEATLQRMASHGQISLSPAALGQWLRVAFEAGEQAARGDVMAAEGRADAALERLHRLKPFEKNHAEFQATVADALLWFDGYSAAFAMREPYDRPNVPSRERLRELNAALQRLAQEPGGFGSDDEIPF